MRSLVSDLIPEYNKKLQIFFKETLATFCGDPAPLLPLSPSLLSHHRPMCAPLSRSHYRKPGVCNCIWKLERRAQFVLHRCPGNSE